MRVPQSWERARVTLAIAAITAAAWLIASALGYEVAAGIWGGFIPARLTGVLGDAPLAPVWLTPLTATLVHAGFIHLGFNLLMFLFCGRSVETIIGGPGLAILYVAGAYGAAIGHYVMEPMDVGPMVGASGAISAILGAYAMLFGRNKVRVANPTVALWLNALWLLAAWIALQLALGLISTRIGIGVAIGAHIGGFLAGLLLVKPLLLFRYRTA